MSGNLVMFEEEQQEIQATSMRLASDANATAVLVIDRNGQEIAHAGRTENLDVTSLASLFAGNVAATGEIAKLLDEKEFSGQFHEGACTKVHTLLVAQSWILVVLFDGNSQLGLVRLRAKKASEELAKTFKKLTERSGEGRAATALGEITDDDIDGLFNE